MAHLLRAGLKVLLFLAYPPDVAAVAFIALQDRGRFLLIPNNGHWYTAHVNLTRGELYLLAVAGSAAGISLGEWLYNTCLAAGVVMP